MKPGDTITKSQVEDLGAKLEQFAQTLPKQERDVLGWVLTRASTSGELSDADMENVAGGLSLGTAPGFQRPTSQLIGRSLGFGGSPADLAAIRITGSWSW
jgi:hypothetical protein